MIRGKIIVNRSMIGISYGINDFVKLGMKDLASQVIDNDLVDFVINNNKGFVKSIIERKKQPYVAQVKKTDTNYIYINIFLLNPISSIRINRKDIESNMNIKINEYIVGWIDLNFCFVTQTFLCEKEMINYYYNQLNLINPGFKIFTETKRPIQNYKDLRHLETFHVDPEGCEDIDDFISLEKEKNIIYIHIIDISYYVLPGTMDDIKGMKYGNTWYFPDFIKHLFDKELKSKELHSITMEINRLLNVNMILNIKIFKG
jgi:hypothetical protein